MSLSMNFWGVFCLTSLFVLLALAVQTSCAGQERNVQMTTYGKTEEGQSITQYVVTNKNGMSVKIITYGGIITELKVPDRRGKLGDVVLGFEQLSDYLKGHPYFGAITGRVANRIAKASFSLEGKEYKLAANDGVNTLHGGRKGFDKVVWKGEILASPRGQSVRLTYVSPDGEEGYPGKMSVAMTYTLADDNELFLDYEADSDKATPINLTNHSYFHLGGPENGNILNHEVKLYSSFYTPVDEGLIPTGEILKVEGTPLDFRRAQTIGSRLAQLKPKPGGYDHNFVLDGFDGERKLAAEVYEPVSGRVMQVYTTEPGIQFYTGNFLNGELKGKRGTVYAQHGGFCLETQHYPDSIHHPHFPRAVLRPGEVYRSTTSYRFSIR